MTPWSDKGPIRGQLRSNFKVCVWARCVAVPTFNLGDKSIGDVLRSPKCFLGLIKQQPTGGIFKEVKP